MATTDSTLRSLFATYGPVVSIHYFCRLDSLDRSVDFEFEKEEDARRARSHLNGHILEGSSLRVRPFFEPILFPSDATIHDEGHDGAPASPQSGSLVDGKNDMTEQTDSWDDNVQHSKLHKLSNATHHPASLQVPDHPLSTGNASRDPWQLWAQGESWGYVALPPGDPALCTGAPCAALRAADRRAQYSCLQCQQAFCDQCLRLPDNAHSRSHLLTHVELGLVCFYNLDNKCPGTGDRLLMERELHEHLAEVHEHGMCEVPWCT